MEILGVGVPEMAFILLIALIVLGPKDMIEAGRTIGKTLRKIVTSPTWKAVRSTGRELQQLPTRLMREAGIDEELNAIEEQVREATDFRIDPRRADPRPDETGAVPSAEQGVGSDPSSEDPQA
jgi:Sec-independent protein translocase protein TatA